MVHSQRNSRGGSPLTLGTTLVLRRLLLSIFLKIVRSRKQRLIKEKKNSHCVDVQAWKTLSKTHQQ